MKLNLIPRPDENAPPEIRGKDGYSIGDDVLRYSMKAEYEVEHSREMFGG